MCAQKLCLTLVTKSIYELTVVGLVCFNGWLSSADSEWLISFRIYTVSQKKQAKLFLL